MERPEAETAVRAQCDQYRLLVLGTAHRRRSSRGVGVLIAEREFEPGTEAMELFLLRLSSAAGSSGLPIGTDP